MAIPPIADRVRESLDTYCRLRGIPPLNRIPNIGPRGQMTVLSTDFYRLGSFATVQEIHFDLHTPYWSVGVSQPDPWTYCDNLRMEDCLVSGGDKWGSRSYGMREGNRISNCAFVDTWPEHHLYWNVAGYGRGEEAYSQRPTLMIERCYFEDAGSQDVQIVQRETDWYGQTPIDHLTPGGPIIVMDSVSRNAGYGKDFPNGKPGQPYDGDPRSSFAFSFFRSRNNVAVIRSLVDKTMQTTSSGALLVEDRPVCVVKSSGFMVAEAKQPIALFRGVRHLEITGSLFQASSGQDWIEIENCQNVRIAGCSGTARIHKIINGRSVQVGTMATGYEHRE